MRRTFWKVSSSGFEITSYDFRRSPKIIIVAGFMVISFFFLGLLPNEWVKKSSKSFKTLAQQRI